MSENENSMSGWTAIKFLSGVGVMCYIYPPMLGFVLAICAFGLINFVLYLFFLDFNRTFRK